MECEATVGCAVEDKHAVFGLIAQDINAPGLGLGGGRRWHQCCKAECNTNEWKKEFSFHNVDERQIASHYSRYSRGFRKIEKRPKSNPTLSVPTQPRVHDANFGLKTWTTLLAYR